MVSSSAALGMRVGTVFKLMITTLVFLRRGETVRLSEVSAGGLANYRGAIGRFYRLRGRERNERGAASLDERGPFTGIGTILLAPSRR